LKFIIFSTQNLLIRF